MIIKTETEQPRTIKIEILVQLGWQNVYPICYQKINLLLITIDDYNEDRSLIIKHEYSRFSFAAFCYVYKISGIL